MLHRLAALESWRLVEPAAAWPLRAAAAAQGAPTWMELATNPAPGQALTYPSGYHVAGGSACLWRNAGIPAAVTWNRHTSQTSQEAGILRMLLMQAHAKCSSAT